MSCDNRYNIKTFQGSTFGLTITVKDSAGNVSNLTNYSARMQIRDGYDAPAATESLSTANGEITITPSEGNVALQLEATRTSNIYVDLSSSDVPPRKKYVYDLELIDSSNTVSKLLYGDFVVYAEVTK
jgi:hypothetical protein